MWQDYHLHSIKGTRMKILITLSLALALAACGSSSADPSATPSDSTSPTSSYTPVPQSELVPAKCEDTGILELLNGELGFKKLAYIPAPENYVPTPDLPIYPVLSNGGLVCVAANNEEQFGLYVFWTPDNGEIFDSQVEGWLGTGYKEIEIPGISSDRQLYVIKEPTDASPDTLVGVTFVKDGIWYRVDAFWGPNATFEASVEGIQPLIDKAIAAVN